MLLNLEEHKKEASTVKRGGRRQERRPLKFQIEECKNVDHILNMLSYTGKRRVVKASGMSYIQLQAWEIAAMGFFGEASGNSIAEAC